MKEELINKIKEVGFKKKNEIKNLLRDLIGIKSICGDIKDIVTFVENQAIQWGLDFERDPMGNALIRIGEGPRAMVYDAHLDTVGVGDINSWKGDPFNAYEEDGVIYGLGAGDEKGGFASMFFGMVIARELNLLPSEFTLYLQGNAEEICDGLASQVLVENKGMRPEGVVIGEPTGLRIYRGHRGRVEFSISFTGRSAHASMPHLGENALIKSSKALLELEELNKNFLEDHFLGKGSLVVSDLKVDTSSINAVPAKATLFIDRRLTAGETLERVKKEIEEAIQPYGGKIEVIESVFKAYTGMNLKLEHYFPSWALPEMSPFVKVAQETHYLLTSEKATLGRWNFSTNGVYWMGKAGIPTIGYGPGEEEYAHTSNDQVPVDHLLKATEFYALFPHVFSQRNG